MRNVAEKENENVEMQSNLWLFPANADMNMEQYALMIHLQNLVNTYGNETVYKFLNDQLKLYKQLQKQKKV